MATNITAKGATIVWRTDMPEAGALYYSNTKDKLGTKKRDDRDTDGNAIIRRWHYVSLNNLIPGQIYRVRFVPNARANINRDPDLVFKTPSMHALSSFPPVYGRLINKQGNSIANALVFLSINNAGKLSSLTKNDGSFLLSLCCLVNLEANREVIPKKNDVAELNIISDDGESAKVSVSLDTASPLPEAIILGSTQSFLTKERERIDQAVLSAQTGKPEIIYDAVDIFYPQEGAAIPGRRPIFKGQALKNSSVTLIIESPKKIIRLITDETGIWKYTPDFNLEPGHHKVTLESVDDKGRKVRKTHLFAILKSGEAVLGEATPEGDITPTVTPEVEIPPTIPIPTEITTPVPTIPISGVEFTAFSLMSLALIFLGAGMILVF